MLSQVVSNKFRQQRGSQQEAADTSMICEFLKMNPPSFTGSSTIEELEYFVVKLKNVFEIIHVIDVERVDVDTHQLQSAAKTWLYQRKKGNK